MSATLKMPESCKLRLMDDSDVSEVMCVERKAYSHPWTEKVMRNCLKASHYHGWVLEVESSIKGYAFLSVAADEMHVLNLCIHPELQGQGWGRELLRCLFDMAANTYQANMCFLEVRPSNSAAVALYESEGFNEIGTRKNYYPADHGREDALVMAKSIIP